MGSPLVPEVKIIMNVSIGADLGVRHQRPRGRTLGPLGGVHVDDPAPVQVEPVEQLGVLAVDQDHLAVRAAYVGEQRVPAAGRVEADQHVAAERRRGHRAQHVGGVAEQHARRAAGRSRSATAMTALPRPPRRARCSRQVHDMSP